MTKLKSVCQQNLNSNRDQNPINNRISWSTGTKSRESFHSILTSCLHPRHRCPTNGHNIQIQFNRCLRFHYQLLPSIFWLRCLVRWAYWLFFSGFFKTRRVIHCMVEILSFSDSVPNRIASTLYWTVWSLLDEAWIKVVLQQTLSNMQRDVVVFGHWNRFYTSRRSVKHTLSVVPHRFGDDCLSWSCVSSLEIVDCLSLPQ